MPNSYVDRLSSSYQNSHKLLIETGRYGPQRLPTEERICWLCSMAPATQQHYIGYFPVYYEIRGGGFHCLFREGFDPSPESWTLVTRDALLSSYWSYVGTRRHFYIEQPRTHLASTPRVSHVEACLLVYLC